MAEPVHKIDLPDDGGFARRMREARLSASLTLEAVAAALSITDSAIAQWESGRTRPGRRRLAEFCLLVGRDPVWIQTGVNREEGSGRAQHLVPKLTWSVAADLPADGWEDFCSRFESIQPHHPCSERAFALEIADNLNAPEFQVGDIVILDPLGQPRVLDCVLAVRNGRKKAELAHVAPRLEVETTPQLPPNEREERAEQARAMIDEAVKLLIANSSPEEAASFLKKTLGEWQKDLLLISPLARFDLVFNAWRDRVSLGLGLSGARIVATMTEHSKRRRSLG